MTSLEVFTLADDQFLPGVAALINSLRAHGFTGQIVVGSPSPLEPLRQLPDVRVVSLAGEQAWIGCLKPALLLKEARGPFVFLDADIVVGGDSALSDLETISETGLTLPLEGLVAPHDHRRYRWAARLGTEDPRGDAWAYFNSGLLAGRIDRDRAFLGTWDQALRRVLPNAGAHFHDADFQFPEQDVLNALVQSSAMRIVSLQSPDWWSAVAPLNPFLHVGGLKHPAFFHGTGKKPWEIDAIPPRAPHSYEERWYRHAIQDPRPAKVECHLSPEVQNWLAGSWSGRLVSRGRRLRQRLRGR